MGQKINYIIKGQPTTIKEVGSTIIGTAVILFIIGDFLYTPLKSLPLELQIFAIGELIPKLFFDFNLIVVLLFFVGMTVYAFRWRNGTVTLSNNQILIDGQIAVTLMLDKIKEINFIDSEFLIGNKRLIQVMTSDKVFKLKFRTDETYGDFSEKIVFAAGQYENIKITRSINTKPSDD